MPSVRKLINWFTPEQARHIAEINGGWMPVNPMEKQAWVYASATTITLPSEATATDYYPVGTRIRLKQSGGTYKYFNVVGVAAQLLTITGGTDYTLANEAITDVEISTAEYPLGFPAYFNYSATLTGFSANPTNTHYKFRINGRFCTAHVVQGTNGTSNANTFTVSVPVSAINTANEGWGTANWVAVNNGATLAAASRAYISPGNSSVTLHTNMGNGTWATSNGKRASFTLEYQYA